MSDVCLYLTTDSIIMMKAIYIMIMIITTILLYCFVDFVIVMHCYCYSVLLLL